MKNLAAVSLALPSPLLLLPIPILCLLLVVAPSLSAGPSMMVVDAEATTAKDQRKDQHGTVPVAERGGRGGEDHEQQNGAGGKGRKEGGDRHPDGFHEQEVTVPVVSLSTSYGSTGSGSGHSPYHRLNPHRLHVPALTWQGYVFIAIVCFVFVSLLMSLAPMFAILGLAGLILYLFGIITADQLFSGLVNNGVLAIAMLFVVVHPLVSLPVMKIMVKWILGEVPKDGDAEAKRKVTSERSARMARFKLCLLCLLTSPFLENTPQVAMFTPLVASHCREIGVAPSQIIMPMNVAVLLGNWALLGSSSNVIISGMMQDDNLGPLPFFELAKVNLLLLIPVLLYCVFMPPILLPKRRGGVTFYAHVKITQGSPYVGRRVHNLLRSFFEVRKDDVDQVVVVKKGSSSSTGSVRLTEPFSRFILLEAGDELIVSGLVDTLIRSEEVEVEALSDKNKKNGGGGGDHEMSAALLGSMNTISIENGDKEEQKSQPSLSESNANEEDETVRIAMAAAVMSMRCQQKGYVECCLKNLIETMFFAAEAREFSGPEGHFQQRGGATTGPQPHLVVGAAGDDHHKKSQSGKRSKKKKSRFMQDTACLLTEQEASRFILSYCQAQKVMLMSLKVSKEGKDMLEDKVAFAMAPNASTVIRKDAATQQQQGHDVEHHQDQEEEEPQQREEHRTMLNEGEMMVVLEGDKAASPTSPRSTTKRKQFPSDDSATGDGGAALRTRDATEDGGEVRPAHDDEGRVECEEDEDQQEQQDGEEEAPPVTMSDKHRAYGGKLYSISVPRWFPLGTVEVPEELRKKYDDKQEEELSKVINKKVLRFPWFYQYLSLILFLGIIIASLLEVKLKVSCMIAAVLTVVLQLVSSKELARTLPVQIYLLIAFSFPLGIGMKESGLAETIEDLMAKADFQGFPLLLVVGGLALVFTNMITNQGSVQVLFPVVVHVYRAQDRDPLPGIIMLATVLCCAVCTPFAIPANAIIIEPGGYRAKDFIKFGLLLSGIVWILAAVLVAMFYNDW